jgi:SAM-dependent methyltransferase
MYKSLTMIEPGPAVTWTRSTYYVSGPLMARSVPRVDRHAGTDMLTPRSSSTNTRFGHYPPAVDRVIAIEPESRLRQLATAAARTARVPVTVTDGLASALPAADASFDAAVATFVLCTVPDQDAALWEIRRVLKPGGLLCFLEHVRADTAGLTRIQLALDAAMWPHLFGGCHLGRDTVAAIGRAGPAQLRPGRLQVQPAGAQQRRGRAAAVPQQLFQHLHQLPQRHDRGQPYLGVGACRRVHEPPAFCEVSSHAVKLA